MKEKEPLTNQLDISRSVLSSEDLLDSRKFLLPGHCATVLVQAVFQPGTNDYQGQAAHLQAIVAYPYSTLYGSPRPVLTYHKLVAEFNNGSKDVFQDDMEQLLMAALNATIITFGLSTVNVHPLKIFSTIYFEGRDNIEYSVKAIARRRE